MSWTQCFLLFRTVETLLREGADPFHGPVDAMHIDPPARGFLRHEEETEAGKRDAVLHMPGAEIGVGEAGGRPVELVAAIARRSGFSFAICDATRKKGHWLGSLQSCTVPFLMRQPVSPNTAMRCGAAFGRVMGIPSSVTSFAAAGSAMLHRRGKSAFGSARVCNAICLPSAVMSGHSPPVTTRSSATPPGPI